MIGSRNTDSDSRISGDSGSNIGSRTTGCVNGGSGSVNGGSGVNGDCGRNVNKKQRHVYVHQ